MIFYFYTEFIMKIINWVKTNKVTAILSVAVFILYVLWGFSFFNKSEKTPNQNPILKPEVELDTTGVAKSQFKIPNTSLTPTTTLTPLDSSIKLVSPCTSNEIYKSSTIDPPLIDACRVVELRVRDLLQETRNNIKFANEVVIGKTKYSADQNKTNINILNNELFDLWLTMAGYGLGTDPYLYRNIFASKSGFSQAYQPPNYGIQGPTREMGIPRLIEHILINSKLAEQEKINRKRELLTLTQSYSNPAVYPHKVFYENAYGGYRDGFFLDSEQFKTDIDNVAKWLADLEKVLLQITPFLNI